MKGKTFQDKETMCKDCYSPFKWLGAEREFYSDKGFNPPERCPDYRAYLKRKAYSSRRPDVRWRCKL